MSRTGAIVVHHRNFPMVLRTIHLLAESIPPSCLIVVDNSDDPDMLALLRQELPNTIAIHAVPNRGYGAAVNFGADILLAGEPNLDYILVSTHETVPAKDAIILLQQALDDDPTLAVAGPSLVTREGGCSVYWSHGGRLSRFLNEPRHVAPGVPVTTPLTGEVERRAWVDGAFCLYRAVVLAHTRFREDFFLYFEETELHTRLRRNGHQIGWVPAAIVEQSSDGIPPYLLARNLQRFQTLHGSLFQRALTVPIVILRRAIKKIARYDSKSEIGDLLRGWRDGISS